MIGGPGQSEDFPRRSDQRKTRIRGFLEDAQFTGRTRTLGTTVDATPRLCLRLLLEALLHG